ncbi:structural maintenance of chromosomes flexible hinge domain-containing protein GMI1 isoform X3 [Musa acuminata AAA Group]|uniref:structural maintenance of chromosomes flexible hinge domain-containing protein GMI1 isoform X3 n=1 Tax=Musa acuminata AAA Group TaxID=214697 RepID=UPI0031D722CF
MANRRSSKRSYLEFLDGNDDGDSKVYRFQILLPNGASVRLIFNDPGEDMFLDEFIHIIRKELEKTAETTTKASRKIFWNGNIYLEDMSDNKIRKKISFSHFRTNKCHILRLHDEGGESLDTYHNMWDLTPHTDLLAELPAEYTFETALADLLDNSLQAVWSNGSGERRLVRVTVDEQKIEIFDSGQGMDGSEENCITKWGKMGSSKHRACRSKAIGTKAPYLMPFFGMFGYGGPIATMHLGRHATVSSKTKGSRKVYSLYFSREALLNQSTPKCIWRTDGGVREPLDEETQTSPHGSFAQVVIRDLKLRCLDIYKLQCFLKDIYFPYIQCDTEYTSRKTAMPIEFEVNDINLAEIQGGDVTITNLLSCNGPDFIMQLRFMIKSENPGSLGFQEANAQLKCVYFPIVEGKENIERILEKLVQDGYEIKENFDTFSRVSIRRLGRLLPDSRWNTLPFMETKQRRGDKAHLLKRCCKRVKCFVETDAGFSPTPSKTDLAHHHPFTHALRNFGNILCGKESEVTIEILKDGKHSSILQLEKEYRDWVIQMHDRYDEEINCGEDEPVHIIGPQNKKQLGITADVVRVHQAIKRRGIIWESGQKVKIFKGATGCLKKNLYATLEYILIEGFQGDVGGDARLICRVGSYISYLSVVCLDRYSNQIPFSSIPEATIKIFVEECMLLHVGKMKMILSSDQLLLELKDILIESSKLDLIQPSYEAVLAICSQDGLFSAEIPCKVMPGTLSSVRLQTSLQEGEYLVPEEVIEELVLEMFDAYGNHIEEGVEVFIHTDGFSFQDHLGYIRKVNCKGCIDLSGLLTVSANFGSYAHLSVSYDKEIVYKKKFQVAQRELRAVSGVSGIHPIGCQLENVIFEVFDPDGQVDEKIHGQYHTLRIVSDSLKLDDTIQYTFHHGRCTVPFVPVPRRPGPFCFSAFHTRYHDLCTDIEVNVLEASKLELFAATESYGTFQSQVLDHMDSSKCLSHQKDLLVKYISHHTQILDEKITEVGLKIGEHERKLKTLNDQKIQVEQDIHDLRVFIGPQYLSQIESLSSSREEILKRIERKGDTAAAICCCLSKAIQKQEPWKCFTNCTQDVVGLVALLGNVNTSKNSRMFSQFLGEDNMLAIVCKSYEAASRLEYYDEAGKIDHQQAVHGAAATLGINISRRFPVICLEDIRPYQGRIRPNDPQRRLCLSNPLLQSGAVPAGFLGYAVNMINLDIHHCNTKTLSGHGLRETLFYLLFGETQVYQTRADMRQARSCIKQGAISLDGGIVRASGFILLGDCEPDVMFPVIGTQAHRAFSQDMVMNIKQMEEKKGLLTAIQQEIVKEYEAYTEDMAKFKKRSDRLRELLTESSSTTNLLEWK